MTPPRIGSRQLLETLLDPDSFVSWDSAPLDVARTGTYRSALTRASEAAGTDESVLTGEGLLRGRRVAVIACEFGFLAGSVGVAAAERVVTAVERATELGLPLVASPTSGGTRMQEGTLAFVQMVKIAGAVTVHKAAGHPYVVYLRNPTMGGVFASWGSLGHITFAEPGALIGFLGPRVYEALYGHPFPEGVQTAENLYRNGVIDGVVEVRVFRRIAHRALSVFSGIPRLSDETKYAAALAVRSAVPAVGAWESVLASRRPDRPGLRELLRRTTQRVPLSGTGQGETDRTVVLALARFHGRPCVVFGHDRAHQDPEHTMGPAALREARRSMQLAAELGLPLVLVIDTIGAALSKEAEERGLAPEIARCLADLVTLPTPTISVLLGQGTGGGALALLPADRVLAAAHGWLAPLPPEGASAIVHRDTAHAPELAAVQRIRSADLLADGIVDHIVPEYPDAAAEPDDFARRMVAAIAGELAVLSARSSAELRATRHRRYRRLGVDARADGLGRG
ncbi:carboxyl transferase domain-containing protein [Nocardia sp. NBC_01329]|uniref:carboxyl transferase domain-containing protein n=1 Tax=Nocardia sp. NBC_01329 TaxID=2903594 RepID=UPI002E10888F|nr:acetyl-CoA carboxylase carboxyltransferase subunit alpha/beta [Nocardia sp. NBC_01329]